MKNHKYEDKELRTRAKIKKAGFEITLVTTGQRIGGPSYAPVFGPDTETTLYALITSNEQLFRNNTSSVVKGDLLLMVSTENVDGDNPPAVGDTVKIERSTEFPKVTTGEYLIVEVKPLAPAGVQIFFVLGISGRQT